MKFEGPLLNERWKLGPRMGAGSQATTYVAKDTKGEHGRVVVKQLSLEKAGGSWKNFDLFEREMRVLKSLRHPGIPRFIEYFESEPGTFNLVMQKMPGATLRAFSKRVRFDDNDIRDILARALEILDYLHKLKPPVIHRDIKPANLLRAQNGKISLVDFGGVRDLIRTDGGSTMIGTFGYMAPEQLHGQATPATDIYALGATMVALSAGVDPENIPRKGLRMDLRAQLDGTHPGLIEVFEAMTEPDPDDRPQSAREVSEMLGRSFDRKRLPPRKEPSRALARRDDESVQARPFEELSDMLDSVPVPVSWLLRVVLGAVALGGYIGVNVLRFVTLPIVFVLVGIIAGSKSRESIDSAHDSVAGALDQGIDGFRHLGERCLPGGRKRGRRALPKGKDD